MSDFNIAYFLLAIVPMVLAITVHEVAHGWVARQCGDPTAMMLGRLTLNPVKHVDPIGTLLVPLVLLVLHVSPIGWAKPVPVTWENLRNPKRDMVLVAVAGPLANLLMAVGWLGLMVVAISLVDSNAFKYPLVAMAEVGVLINLMLMALNLVPIPPLDGGRVLTGLLPGPLAYRFAQIEPYGMFIVIALFASGILSTLLLTPVSLLQGFLYHIAGLPQ